jgi:hypothetical protein
VEQAQAMIKKLAVAQETATGIVQNVKEFFAAVGEFFSNLLGRLSGK